jgi:hypothetical protein
MLFILKQNNMVNIFYNSVSNGPGKVVTNLLLGLEKANIPYKNNGIVLPDDKLLILQSHSVLHQSLANDRVIGPNICTLPIDDYQVMSQNYKKMIVPCEWVKDLYLKWLPEDKLFVWPVGINTDTFYDMSGEEKEIDCLIYFKRRNESELQLVIDFLNQNNQSYEVIRYGSYSEEHFINTLKKSKYGIVIDKCESQGIAIEEMMSTNLPLLVWDTIIWDDRGEEFAVPATSVPYWDDSCGVKIDNADDLREKFNFFMDNLKSFNPRTYILNNLALDESAKKIINVYE